MGQNERYVFSREQRAALEALPLPMAAYQYIDDHVITLLVSEGMCQFTGIPREMLIDQLDQSMFASVHPDDINTLAKLGYEFATKGGVYDIVYRSRISKGDEYRLLHVTGYDQLMETGARVAFLYYSDITGMNQNQVRTFSQIHTPQTRFLDENISALAVVSRDEKRLLYYNKALSRMLPPQSFYDTNVSFNQFFFGDEQVEIDGLFLLTDLGPRAVKEPLTGRQLEVNVLSATFGDEPAYVIYFFEQTSESGELTSESSLRLLRTAFNAAITTGETTDLAFYQDCYKGFRVWNLTKNTLVHNAGCKRMFGEDGSATTFDEYCRIGLSFSADEDTRKAIESFSREQLLQVFELANAPREAKVCVHTPFGIAYLCLQFSMLRSPDTGDVFVKVEESNITYSSILDMLISKTIEQEYDYVAYSDLEANKCLIISGRKDAGRSKQYTIQTRDVIRSPQDIRTFSGFFPAHVQTTEDMHRYLVECCDEEGRFHILQ